MIHSIYKTVGYVLSRVMLIYYNLRDLLFVPKEESILFVAHPDDEILFFYTYLKEHKPYVVLMTTGWSLRRVYSFRKAMRKMGIKYKIYEMETDDIREELIKRRIRHDIGIGRFKKVITHNQNGEYGHSMHKRIHHCVISTVDIPVYCPVDNSELLNHRLSERNIENKIFIFSTIYKSEIFVLEEYKLWVEHEFLERSAN